MSIARSSERYVWVLCSLLAPGRYDGSGFSLSLSLSRTARLSSSKSDVVSTRREYSHTTRRINKIYPWTTCTCVCHISKRTAASHSAACIPLPPCGGCVDGNFSVARRADFKGSSSRERERERDTRAYLVSPLPKKRGEKEKKSAVNVCTPGIFRAMRDRAAKWR